MNILREIAIHKLDKNANVLNILLTVYRHGVMDVMVHPNYP